MRDPNWHHFAKILHNLGYKMVRQQEQGILCFVHDEMRMVLLEKMNRYDDAHVDKYLSLMKLPRPFFEPIYKNCCKR